MSWIPDIIDLMVLAALKVNKERREAGMEETDANTVIRAIEIFKERYGIKAPLTLFEMDDIITELKEEKRNAKNKKGRTSKS